MPGTQAGGSDEWLRMSIGGGGNFVKFLSRAEQLNRNLTGRSRGAEFLVTHG